MTGDRVNRALAPFLARAKSEASRDVSEDGHITGPGTLAVGDWRELYEAFAPTPVVSSSLDVAALQAALEAEWPWHWRDDHDGTRRGPREAAEAVIARLAHNADTDTGGEE